MSLRVGQINVLPTTPEPVSVPAGLKVGVTYASIGDAPRQPWHSGVDWCEAVSYLPCQQWTYT